MTRTFVAIIATLACCLGCASPDAAVSPPPPGTGGASPTGSGGSAGGGGAGGAADAPPVNPLGRPRCTPPDGMSGTPQTIEDAVALLNALPKPTSVACFV